MYDPTNDIGFIFGRIKPVRRSVHGLMFSIEIKEDELDHVAFNWVGIGKDLHLNLKVIDVFLARITCGYYGFLKVNYPEVVKQMPKELRERATAISIPDMTFDDKFIITDGRGHVYQRIPILVYEGKTDDREREIMFELHKCHGCNHGLEDHLPSDRETGNLGCKECECQCYEE